MVWVLVALLVAVLVVSRIARRHRESFPVSASEPISTMHLEMAKKRTGETKAALAAANKILR